MRIGSFFTGIGAPEQALKNLMLDGMEYQNEPLEIDLQFACDINKYAEQTFLANFNPFKFYRDITKLKMEELPKVDLLTAGFPCQSFSLAGKRLGFEDTRGTLFFDLLRYIKEHTPKYFILENVKGLTSHDKGKTLDTILKCLGQTINNQISFFKYEDSLNYNIHYQVLNTKDYGLPQNRERIFIVGIRKDLKNCFKFPKPMKLKIKLKDILEKKVNEKYYLSQENIKKLEAYNKRNKEKGNGFQAKWHDPEEDNMSSLKVGGGGADDLIKVKGAALRTYPRTTDPDADKKKGRTKKLEIREDENVNSLTEAYNDSLIWIADYRHDEGLRKRKNKISPALATRKHSATDISTMPPIIKTHSLYPRSSKTGKGGTGPLSKKDGTAYCLDTGNHQAIEYQNRIRRLTPLECFRLQGFPDDFKKPVSDTQLYKQAGNTISVPVIELIIKNLLTKS